MTVSLDKEAGVLQSDEESGAEAAWPARGRSGSCAARGEDNTPAGLSRFSCFIFDIISNYVIIGLILRLHV